MDVPDIMLVIQWRATCKLSTLWQWFGRAVRDRCLQGTALLFAEKEHFDEERQAIASVSKRCALNTLNSRGIASHTQPTTNIGDHGDESDGSDEDATPPMDGGLQGLNDFVKGNVEVSKYTVK